MFVLVHEVNLKVFSWQFEPLIHVILLNHG